jgi:Na+-driven multidrug efflux pump
MLLVVLWQGRNRAGITIRASGLGAWRPDLTVARRVLTIGVPAALEQILVTTYGRIHQ